MASDRKTAVLLVNLGSPAAPTVPAVRQFLREFLWDHRVVNLPRLLWWFILHFFVLPFRPSKSLKAYKKIWHDKGSPLIYLTRQLTEKIAGHLASKGISVDYAMRYGEPSITGRLQLFSQEKVTELIILPLYPQYSSTTTASVYDDVAKEFSKWRYLPSFHFISDYHQNGFYINAISDSIRQSWETRGRSQLLMMSFHGLPEQLTKWGDPYYYHCQKTAALIAEKLNLKPNEWQIVFQSRFGKAEWLKPYCADTLKELPGRAIKSVDVVCPGFAVDCLETLEEIAMENKSLFIEAGGEVYNYIPALNDSDRHAEVLLSLVNDKLH